MSEAAVVFKKKRRREEASTSTKPKSSLDLEEPTPQIYNPASADSTARDSSDTSSQLTIQDAGTKLSAEQQQDDNRATVHVEHRKEGKVSFYGPKKSSSNVRTITMFDYKPDICKDYKQTGYCGYGDACIFLHDRGDYKLGWEIEKEWEDEQRKKRLGLAKKDAAESKQDESIEHEKLALICPICSKQFVNPVKTKCGHVFCEECALQHHKKDKKCAVCKVATDGIFNTAADVIQKLKKST
jgi:hypothetical protein